MTVRLFFFETSKRQECFAKWGGKVENVHKIMLIEYLRAGDKQCKIKLASIGHSQIGWARINFV